MRYMRTIAIIAITSMVHVSVLPAVFAAPKPVSVTEEQAMSTVGDIPLDEFGTPANAQSLYYPAEKNPLLGRASFMTPIECMKRYGPNFCACSTLQDGTQFCYYKRPAAGYFSTIADCEAIWGAGYCICDGGSTNCRLYQGNDEKDSLQCMGTVYFFSGEKMECRKAGLLTAGKDCCSNPSKSSDECSFENTAKKLGLDDLAMLSLSLGTKLADFALEEGLTDYLSKQVARVIVEEWVEAGTTEGIMASMTSLLGDSMADAVLGTVEESLAEYGSEVIMNAAVEGGMTAIGNAAVGAVAAMISSIISIAGWIYFAYQCYNMYTMLRQCSVGEFILGCKIAKGICHSVGNRCKLKILGVCLQNMKVYCCFNTKLAKILHEQGRPQLGMSWGSGKKPNCKGFLMEQFAKLDLTKIDFTEYGDDLVREMNPNVQEKLRKATERLNQNFRN